MKTPGSHDICLKDLPTDAMCNGEVVLVLSLETAGVGPGVAVLTPVL